MTTTTTIVAITSIAVTAATSLQPCPHLLLTPQQSIIDVEVQIQPLELIQKFSEGLADVRLQKPQKAKELHLENHELMYKPKYDQKEGTQV